jgi:prevent-host-death family protein
VEVGAYEAKTRLSALLARVQKGEHFVITKHGKPVAMLVPAGRPDLGARKRALERLFAFREALRARGVRVTRDEIKAWVNEGRS